MSIISQHIVQSWRVSSLSSFCVLFVVKSAKSRIGVALLANEFVRTCNMKKSIRRRPFVDRRPWSFLPWYMEFLRELGRWSFFSLNETDFIT